VVSTLMASISPRGRRPWREGCINGPRLHI
jgi:hypothetical protein